MTLVKPMLAGKVDLEKLKFPVMVSPKLDGIRALVIDGQLVSRTLKPIPNHHIRNTLSKLEFEGLDGELIVGDPWAKDCFNQSTSNVMRQTGEPDFKFHVFDHHTDKDAPFMSRRLSIINSNYPSFIEHVPHHMVANHEGLMESEKTYVEIGFEGIMIRDPFGRYKYGRSTTNEGLLMKLKRFSDSEAEIIGLEQLYSNQNEAQTNECQKLNRSDR
jgi:DNA ligase-1